MKIAIFVNSFPNLSETFIVNQITGLIDRGHHVDIYSMRHGNSEKVHADVVSYRLLERTRYIGAIPKNYGVRIMKAITLLADNIKWLDPAVVMRTLNIRRYGRAASSLSLLYGVVPLLRERQYDVIHCQFGTVGPQALLFKQIGAIRGKIVTTFRGYDATQYLKKRPGFYDELFREADIFLSVSNSFRKLLVEAGCPENKVRVHHSGIDCSKLELAERRRSGWEPTKVITIARLVEKKGISFALKAIAGILATGRQLTYTIVGDGVLRSELLQMIKELGIGKEVRMVGWKTHDEVIGLMRKSHILIAPSITTADGDQEGIPNAIKEAMALGMPVISTTHSGIPELVEHGVEGFLVPEKDVDALADSLMYLTDNQDIWPVFGQKGRKQIETNYNIHKLNDSLVEVYRQLIEGNSSICSHNPAVLIADNAQRIC